MTDPREKPPEKRADGAGPGPSEPRAEPEREAAPPSESPRVRGYPPRPKR
jgi:hypothetical protein